MADENITIAIPLNKMVSDKPLKLTKTILHEAVYIDKIIPRLVTKILDGVPVQMANPVDFSRAVELHKNLIELDQESHLQKMISSLYDGNYDPMPIALHINQIIDILIQSIPENEMSDDSFLPIAPIQPSFSKLMELLWAARIAENPLWILKLMSDVTLTDLDVKYTQNMYPETFDKIIEEVLTQIMKKYTAKTSLPRKLKIQLSLLLGLPVVSMQTLLSYAKKDVKAEQKKEQESVRNINLPLDAGSRELGKEQ